MAFNVKRHNTRVPYVCQLLSDGVAINLTTAASVTFKMRNATDGDTAPKVSAAAAVISASTGIVSYTWATNDLDTVGTFNAEWLITWNDGGLQTVPNGAYNTITVYEDLDAS